MSPLGTAADDHLPDTRVIQDEIGTASDPCPAMSLPCHEVASAPLLRTNATPRFGFLVACQDLATTPHSAAAGRGPRSQATQLPVIAKSVRSDSPILPKCDTISTSPQPLEHRLIQVRVGTSRVLVFERGHFAPKEGGCESPIATSSKPKC